MPILGLATSGDLNRLEKRIMSSVEAIQAAVEAEAQEVKDHVEALGQQIVDLRKQVEAGSPATVEQLAAIEEGVKNIFTTPSNPDPEA